MFVRIVAIPLFIKDIDVISTRPHITSQIRSSTEDNQTALMSNSKVRTVDPPVVVIKKTKVHIRSFVQKEYNQQQKGTQTNKKLQNKTIVRIRECDAILCKIQSKGISLGPVLECSIAVSRVPLHLYLSCGSVHTQVFHHSRSL